MEHRGNIRTDSHDACRNSYGHEYSAIGSWRLYGPHGGTLQREFGGFLGSRRAHLGPERESLQNVLERFDDAGSDYFDRTQGRREYRIHRRGHDGWKEDLRP